MAVNKLLVAFDESEGADRALAMAASLAAVNPEAHVDVVYVVPIPLLDETQMANFKDILDMMISDGEDLLAEAGQKMARTLPRAPTAAANRHESGHRDCQADRPARLRPADCGQPGLSGLKEYGQRQPQAVARIAHPRADREWSSERETAGKRPFR
ncbi:MAG: universal stress protein [Eggerthella lenta]